MPAENGYVPTPAPIADYVAAATFAAERPSEPDTPRLLLPGLGTGNLYAGVKRYCTPGEGRFTQQSWDYPMPECVGVENDPQLVGAFQTRRPDNDVEVHQTDFLLDPPAGPFDWVLANPPFCRYKNIDEAKRDQYRERFVTAQGQFPLFVPFLEQALELVKPGGWVTFILPVQALTLRATEPLQELLASLYIGAIRFLPPQTFDRQIDTIHIDVKKERSAPYKPPFWLEPLYVYNSKTRETLADLGVDDVDEAKAYYDEMHESYELQLKNNSLAGMVRAALVETRRDRASDGSVKVESESTVRRQASLTDAGWD